MKPIQERIRDINRWVSDTKQAGWYTYLRPIEKVEGAWATVDGRRMLMFASYSYLDLIGHPEIEAAAQAALAQYGTATHGVRILVGTLPLHEELERTIAQFTNTEAAATFSSGFITNLSTISALLGRDDVVIFDKYDHASIVDGCLLSKAKLLRFRHNDMEDLERRLKQADPDAGRLVVVDGVFSMDGDIINLPEVSRLCRKYDALLMVDEAHSLGMLGETGRGIEEHFGLEDVIDIKMGTLSKAIPSVGGYVAGSQELITHLKHTGRAFVFSAALPPAQTAAATAAFEVMKQEPDRVRRLHRNAELLLSGLKSLGFNTLNSETPVVPIICGDDERAHRMANICLDEGILVLAVVTPYVPSGLSRLRVTVTSAHSEEHIAHALDVFAKAGKMSGVIQ